MYRKVTTTPRSSQGAALLCPKLPGKGTTRVLSILPSHTQSYAAFHSIPKKQPIRYTNERILCLFELFLGSQLGGVSALFLAAVCRLGGKTGVAFAADHLVAVELSGEHGKRRIVDSSPQSKDQV